MNSKKILKFVKCAFSNYVTISLLLFFFWGGGLLNTPVDVAVDVTNTDVTGTKGVVVVLFGSGSVLVTTNSVVAVYVDDP